MLKKLTASGIVAAAASGALLLGSPAHAGVAMHGGGVLSGNNVIVPVSIPAVICGNSVAIIGMSGAGCKGTAAVNAPRHHHHWDS